MFNDFLGSKIEITVRKTEDIFQAFCTLFPESIGIGKSEKEAIEDLADLIAFRMADVIKKSAKDIIQTRAVSGSKLRKKLGINKNFSKNFKLKRPENKKDLPGIKFPLRSDIFKKQGLKDIIDPQTKNGLIVMGFRLNDHPFSDRQDRQDIGQLLDELTEKGYWDSPGPESYRTPDSIVLGIPVSFN